MDLVGTNQRELRCRWSVIRRSEKRNKNHYFVMSRWPFMMRPRRLATLGLLLKCDGFLSDFKY